MAFGRGIGKFDTMMEQGKLLQMAAKNGMDNRQGAFSMAALTGIPEVPRLSGVVFKEAWDWSYPPAVESTDVLRVNYDIHAVGRDGLYLVEEIGHSGVVWRGCRRYRTNPITSQLELDATGGGEWVDAAVASTWRIAGRVERVYRPVV